MIKKLLLAIMIALPTLGFAQGKFGVINTATLIEEMPEMKDVKAQLEAASKKYEDEFNKLAGAYQEKYTEFQNLSDDTPKAIKDRRLQELQELEQKIGQFRLTAQQDLEQQQNQLVQPIQQRVMSAIQAVGEEGGYTMIFENMVPVFTGKDVVDVTPVVKTKLGI